MKKKFLKYPWFIGFEYIEIEAQQKLGEEKIPDYLLRQVNGSYNVLEIKGPNDHIFNKKPNNYQFNQYFINGLVQLMRYIDFCDKYYDYILSEHKKKVYTPRGILLIDKNLKPSEKDILNMFTSFLNKR